MRIQQMTLSLEDEALEEAERRNQNLINKGWRPDEILGYTTEMILNEWAENGLIESFNRR